MWSTYGKSLAAFAAAVLVVISSAVTDGRITPDEGIQIAIAAATGVVVYIAPNLPRYPWIKLAMAALLAALNLAVSLITDGLTTAEIVNLVIAALGVLMVGGAPAQTRTATGPVTLRSRPDGDGPLPPIN